MSTSSTIPLVLLAVGSHSDDPKVASVKRYLEGQGIFVFSGVKSIHRTPDALEESARNLPHLPLDVQNRLDRNRTAVRVVIGAAGGAAHLPGGYATHNAFIPVIALPVGSETFGKVFGKRAAHFNAAESMHDMPPEVPNGLAPTPEIAAKMAEKIIRLKTLRWYRGVSVPEGTEMPKDVLDSLGLTIDPESPIQIVVRDVESGENPELDVSKIQIIIPTVDALRDGEERSMIATLNLMNEEGLYMGWQIDKINYTNALLFAAQILAAHGDIDLQDRLKARREAAHDTVRAIDQERESAQNTRLSTITSLIDTGLWPASKPMNFAPGDERLESLGYVRFYTGKNADLYIIPGTQPLQVLMVRTDRTSVFNIPLDLMIEGKGAIQNQVSLLGARFAQSQGIQTVVRDLPKNIAVELQDRCQAIELCSQLEVEVNGERKWTELIFRNYITGSLFKAYKKGENPYSITLPENLKEWDDIRTDGIAAFTPTDKSKDDLPIRSDLVQEQHPEIVRSLALLFKEFTLFARERGYVVVDTKFEVFVDANGHWVLWDEILTPESSRFIRVEDFENGNYISADKQIIREIWKTFGWEAKWNALKASQPTAMELPVAHEVTAQDREKVLAGYRGILDALEEGWDTTIPALTIEMHGFTHTFLDGEKSEDSLVFNPSDLNANFARLRQDYWLTTDAHHVSSLITGFQVWSGEFVPVQEGKYKTALFLYHLAADAWTTTFQMDERRQELVQAYFGPDICRDAISNPSTKHTTVRDLLSGSHSVTITRP